MSKITKSARGKDCQVRIAGICTFDSEKTIWSHYRGSAGGKGMSTKSFDICGAYACTACDAVYDGQMKRPPGMTKEDVDLDWMMGHMRSLVILESDALLGVLGDLLIASELPQAIDNEIPGLRGLRPNAAATKLSMGLSTLWAKVKNDSSFPQPIKTGGRAVIFIESDLDAWISSRSIHSKASGKERNHEA